MKLTPWSAAPLSALMLFCAWWLRPSEDPRIVAQLTGGDVRSNRVDSIDVLTETRLRVASAKGEAERLGRAPIGSGGAIAIEYAFDREAVNQVAFVFRPITDFSTDSVVIGARFGGSGENETSQSHQSIGRRRSAGDLVEKRWTFDRPIESCWVMLPPGADLELQAVVLSRVETSGRLGLYLLAGAVLIPVIVLASTFVARRRHTSRSKSLLFGGALALHAATCLALAELGHNFDLDSWEIVASLVNDGKSVYSSTFRWPYGSPATYLFAGVMLVHDYFRFAGPESFHVLVVSMLCVANIAIAVMLAVSFEWLAGLLFVLFPTGVLITGFHGQIDSLPIALALASWCIVSNAERRRHAGWLAVAALLLSTSLAVKHVMLFFPVGLLMWPPMGNLRRRLVFVGGVYAMFLLHFTPMLLHGETRAGVVHHVFLYRGMYGTGFVPRILLTVGIPPHVLVPYQILKLIWLLGVFGTAYVAARREPRSLPFVYVTSFVVFAPSLADQYLAIPLIACAYFNRHATMWFYVLFSTTCLFCSDNNVGAILNAGGASGYRRLFGLLGTQWFSVAFLAVFLALWMLRISRAAREDRERDEDPGDPLVTTLQTSNPSTRRGEPVQPA